MAAKRPPAIELIGIDKSFGPVHANNNVNLVVERGIIHGIVGENGAGKSTLMSILYGFYEADSGEIRVNGEPVRIRSSREAISHGIGMVHQHFMLVPPLTVLENVMLGAEGGPLLAEGAGAIRKRLGELGREYGLVVDPDAIVGELSVGLQQRVEILKALVRGAEILVLDEPTAVLTPAEADQLFEMLRVLKGENKTIIFITHKLREIMTSDRPRVGHAARGDGRDVRHREDLAARARRRDGRAQGDPEGRKRPGASGRGCARSAQSRGARRPRRRSHRRRFVRVARGRDSRRGRRRWQRTVRTSRGARRHPPLEFRRDSDRRPSPFRRRSAIRTWSGCSASVTCPKIAIASGSSCRSKPARARCSDFIASRSTAKASSIAAAPSSSDAEKKMDAFDVRPRAPLLKTANFSGGNQQKIVLAREIERNPKILLVGQPTRGVDIGAIEFIHKRIVAQRDAGKAVLLVSVELDEIFALSDRIIVLCGGRITGERRPEETNAQDLGLLMAGVSERAA